MYEVFIVCMIILALVHMRRASDYTWCKVDRCESDGRTVNWKDKSCTESVDSPGPGFFNRSLNPTCDDVTQPVDTSDNIIVIPVPAPDPVACTNVAVFCPPGKVNCGRCGQSCCSITTPGPELVYTRDDIDGKTYKGIYYNRPRSIKFKNGDQFIDGINMGPYKKDLENWKFMGSEIIIKDTNGSFIRGTINPYSESGTFFIDGPNMPAVEMRSGIYGCTASARITPCPHGECGPCGESCCPPAPLSNPNPLSGKNYYGCTNGLQDYLGFEFLKYKNTVYVIKFRSGPVFIDYDYDADRQRVIFKNNDNSKVPNYYGLQISNNSVKLLNDPEYNEPRLTDCIWYGLETPDSVLEGKEYIGTCSGLSISVKFENGNQIVNNQNAGKYKSFVNKQSTVLSNDSLDRLVLSTPDTFLNGKISRDLKNGIFNLDPQMPPCNVVLKTPSQPATPSILISGVPDIGYTYESASTARVYSLTSVPIPEDVNGRNPFSVSGNIVKTLHFRKNGTFVFLETRRFYVDGAEDRSNTKTSNICGTYAIGSSNKVKLSEQIKFFEYQSYSPMTDTIDSGFGTDLLVFKGIDNAISSVKSFFTTSDVSNNTFTASKDITGQVSARGSNTVSSPVPFLRMSIEYKFFKRVYNKEYLFTNLCGGNPTPTTIDPDPPSGGGGCSIM